MSVYKYRIYCNDESAYFYKWDTTKPTTCPNNNAHSIDFETIAITDKVIKDVQVLSNDVFDRTKVVSPTTIFSLHNAFGAKSLYCDFNIKGTGTMVVDPLISCKVLGVYQNGDRSVCQTRQYFHYIPGYSKLVYISAVLQLAYVPGVRSRIGVFDDHNDKIYDSKGNGHFFEYANNLLYAVERSSTSGTNQTDLRVEQKYWNVDTLDGNGKSFIKIDPTKALLMLFEYAWLGIGITRMGFMISGKVYWAHIWDHSHLQCPYILYAKLPIRHEIENISGGNVSSYLRTISSSVQIESENIDSVTHGACVTYSEDTERVVSKTAWNPVFSLRLSTAGIRRTIAITKLTIVTDARSIKWRLVLNPSLVGAVWRTITLHPDSLAEYDITSASVQASSNTLSGFPFESGVICASFTQTYDFEAPYEISLNADITGISDIICLQARGVNNTATFSYSLDWCEIF